MIRTLVLISFVLFFYSLASAQDVIVLIKHQLDVEEFEFGKEAESDEGVPYKIFRMEYYLSGFSVTHSGGEKLIIEDLYVLADARGQTVVHLGDLGLESIEAISFFVGVDSDSNHADPASWPNGHALAPVAPSMHWGWAAGYRFVAMEGKSGPSYNTTFQFHGLGDVNYFEQTIPVLAEAEGGQIVVDVIADYNKALTDIGIGTGPISHGETGEAKTCLVNFRDSVFALSSGISAVSDVDNTLGLKTYPNPSMDGHVTIELQESVRGQIDLMDISGRLVLQQNFNSDRIELNSLNSGLYIVNVTTDNGRQNVQMLTVK